MPILGETVNGGLISRTRTHRFIWHGCVDCKKERWVKMLHGVAESSRCFPCAMKLMVKNTDIEKRDRSGSNKTYRVRHPGIAGSQTKKYRDKCRYEAIKFYSGGSMACACCGETHYEFLAIDHMNGGGNQARRERGHGNIGRWLKARGFPEGYRILCHNCNMSIGFYGYCPHRAISQATIEEVER